MFITNFKPTYYYLLVKFPGKMNSGSNPDALPILINIACDYMCREPFTNYVTLVGIVCVVIQVCKYT